MGTITAVVASLCTRYHHHHQLKQQHQLRIEGDVLIATGSYEANLCTTNTQGRPTKGWG
jgi:hypothetical protein